MANSEFLQAILEKLAELARDPDSRVVGQWPGDPSRWHPTSVVDPKTGDSFTEAGAWEFVAEMLVGGNRVNVVCLDAPPDQAGYTMNIELPSGKLHIKVRMGIGKIIGRSFHYSAYSQARG